MISNFFFYIYIHAIGQSNGKDKNCWNTQSFLPQVPMIYQSFLNYPYLQFLDLEIVLDNSLWEQDLFTSLSAFYSVWCEINV